ncbi:MAG: hypothetical protein SFW62_01170 [Alphaproteobacteria bacterium]|nr:hypothetical protein [Alphaproteobacteria bacterium]
MAGLLMSEVLNKGWRCFAHAHRKNRKICAKHRVAGLCRSNFGIPAAATLPLWGFYGFLMLFAPNPFSFFIFRLNKKPQKIF